MSSVENLVKEMIARDRKTFLKDARLLPKYHESKLDSPDTGSDSPDMGSDLMDTGS